MEGYFGVQRGCLSQYIVWARRTVLHTTMWLSYVYGKGLQLSTAKFIDNIIILIKSVMLEDGVNIDRIPVMSIDTSDNSHGEH